MMKKLLCSLLLSVLAIGFAQAQNVFGEVSGRTGNTGAFTLIATTDVAPPTNTPTTAEGTDFGAQALNSTTTNTFQFSSLVSAGLTVALQNITGPDADQFSQDAPTPSSFSGIGATSDFSINFTPTSSGVKTAIIELQVVQPPFFGNVESYFFEITAEGAAAAPSIQVFGDDDIEITNGSTGPVPGDNTHFGNAVSNNESVVRQFTIENNGTGGLVINGIANAFGSTDFTVTPPGGITFPVTINAGSSLTFDIDFSPTSPASPPPIDIAAFIFIDAADDTFDFFYEVIGVGVPPSPDMDVFGNGVLISSGDTSPSATDHTVFPDTDIATVGGSTRTFTIENNGTADLNLTSLSPIVNITGADAADFSVTANPTTPITPGGSTTFTVTFDPTTTGIKDATIEIDNNGVDDPYTFDIRGTATDATVGGFNQLMITQYYEGVDAFDKWIEIKNISGSATVGGVYNLAVFLDEKSVAGTIESAVPDFPEPIPSIPAGGVIVYSRAGASLPSSIGTATIITSEVCSFTGNDVIVISTSTSTNSYNDRIDVVGEVGAASPEDWGTDISIVKGCGTDNIPAILYDPTNVDYDPNQFIELTLDEVNAADTSMNIAIGTHVFGNTTWTGTWSNGTADRTREVVINAAYTNANGSLSACDLTVNTGASVTMDTDGSGSNYVLVTRDLAINGSMTLGDTEALVMTAGATVVGGQITKIEKSTPLSSNTDYTYWSSPVNSSASIESVFSGVDPGRMFYWITPGTDATFPDGNWAAAQGSSMDRGRGYLVEGPAGISSGQQHEVTFSGPPNNGNVNVQVGINLSNTFGDGGWNIIGNPYPSAIDIDLFLKSQQNLELNNGVIGATDATVWLWTHNTPPDVDGEFTAADYATYNLVGGVGSGSNPSVTNIIGSAQGFLVRVISQSNNEVRFTNDMRVVGQNDTQFFKSSTKTTQEKDRVWLNMTSEQGAFNQLLVGFLEDGTDGFDIGYDGRKLGAGNIAFYSLMEDGSNLAIQGFGPFDASKTIPLGFYSFIDARLKISIGAIEGILTDEEVYLVDNDLNITHNLKESDYEFEATSSDFSNERFVLKFNSGVLSTDEPVLNTSFIVFNQDETLKIKSGVAIAELKVYDVTGRLLIDMEPKSASFDVPTQNIKAGTVLILNATMSDGSIMSKKAIKF